MRRSEADELRRTATHRYRLRSLTCTRWPHFPCCAKVTVWLLLALIVAPILLATVDGCKVTIVSPSSGATLVDGSPLHLSFRIKSSANSTCPHRAVVYLHVDGNFVQKHQHECDSYLPVAATAPALLCCSRIIEICVHDIPDSCARSAVSILPSDLKAPWSPPLFGQGATRFVAHNADLAAALQALFPPHDPLLDMSCDAYFLSHRGARVSAARSAHTHMHDYSRAPLSQFPHCIAECAYPPPLFPSVSHMHP